MRTWGGILEDVGLRIFEAIVLTQGQGVSRSKIEEVLPEFTQKTFTELFYELNSHWMAEGKLIELVELDALIRVTVKPEAAPYIDKLYDPGSEQVLGRGSLEVLAIIAAKQPISRPEMEDIRGIQISSRILSGLVKAGWVERIGSLTTKGNATLYCTTVKLLEDLQVDSLAEIFDPQSIVEFDELMLEKNRLQSNKN